MFNTVSNSIFIPVFAYSRLKNISRQKLYRLIREKRLKKGSDYTIIEKTVHRIVINPDYEPKENSRRKKKKTF